MKRKDEFALLAPFRTFDQVVEELGVTRELLTEALGSRLFTPGVFLGRSTGRGWPRQEVEVFACAMARGYSVVELRNLRAVMLLFRRCTIANANGKDFGFRNDREFERGVRGMITLANLWLEAGEDELPDQEVKYMKILAAGNPVRVIRAPKGRPSSSSHVSAFPELHAARKFLNEVLSKCASSSPRTRTPKRGS